MKLTAKQAGRLGGTATLRKYGRGHFLAMARKASSPRDPHTLTEIMATREGRKIFRRLAREFGSSGSPAD